MAAVRWGHRCQPYGKHMEYYHPAWKTVILCYLSNLLMAPAVFMPTEPDAILQLRLLLTLASPFFCAVLLFSYFGRMLDINKWRHPVYALSMPFGVMALSATTLALIPGTQMTPAFCRWFFAVADMLAVAYVNRCRLAHAAQLQVTHPDMPIGEVIVDSGFGSSTTYYKIRKQLEN